MNNILIWLFCHNNTKLMVLCHKNHLLKLKFDSEHWTNSFFHLLILIGPMRNMPHG